MTLAILGVLAIAFTIGLVAAAASAAEHSQYRGDVLPGVQVDGIHAAGKKRLTVSDDVTRLAAGLAQAPIHATAGTRRFTVEPALIGFDVDVDATTRAAMAAGRSGNPIANAAGTMLRRVRPDRVPLVVRYDDARVEGLLDGWANAVDQGVVQGDLRFDGTNVAVIEPHNGVGIRRAEARAALIGALHSASRPRDIHLAIGEIAPPVDRAHVEAAAARARALLATGKEVEVDQTKITVTPAQLAAMLGTRVAGTNLDLTIDTGKLRAALGPAVASLERPAADATFNISASGAVSVVASRNGRGVDLDAIARDILGGATTIAAHAADVHPAHDTAWARHLGITKQVATFTTRHPAGQPRVHNIHVAADVLNNTVVEPNQVFSLNAKLGPRTPDKGYVKAPILVEDGFGEDYGGGVSQLTTTLFNAAWFGGYDDVDHSPHHFYISRYPMGREATVNYPSVDLKFRDDTAHGVLIRTSYTATSITVTLYGDNDGRTVREDKRQVLHTEPITDQLVPCPAKKPTDDPNNRCATLQPGEHYTAQDGETGYDVEFDRVIDQPGLPERRQHYQVHYPMLPNKVLVGATAGVGTSTSVPAGSTTTVRHR